MRRQFYSKNIKILKFFDQNNLGSLPRIFLCSLLVIFFFYSMPIILSFVNENDLAVENNSKKVLAYTLNSKNKSIEGNDDILDEKDLLVDNFSLNEIESKSVRLNS